ncbi:MAG: hypothetical protein GXO74_10465 [Calditrichaeota bacterium]|nr:hypothetical protein [Calditrichota bacterium]
MKVYYFCDTDWENALKISRTRTNDVLSQLSGETDTSALVVAIYLLRSHQLSGGVAIVQQNITPAQFAARRGKWAFTKQFIAPADLPEKFKLIRLKFNLNETNYPLQQIDQYGWEWHYHSFIDHFAFLFAHELHHFRRYHLGFHPREGEHSANQWALTFLQKSGYQIQGRRVIFRQQRRKPVRVFFQKLQSDRYQKFRDLQAGDSILIHYDPRGRYENELAEVMRPLRKNSKRVVIATADGKNWRWPLEWVHLVN